MRSASHDPDRSPAYPGREEPRRPLDAQPQGSHPSITGYRTLDTGYSRSVYFFLAAAFFGKAAA